ncbi:MAG: Bax inhibitor-1/YccA family protein [Kineosporiaceae bacterium]|nr:Bax inhibitor-1/YccA family protein [Kineosporiaceae bacterium]
MRPALWQGNDIIVHAIVGTLCAFGAMLGLCKTAMIRSNPKFPEGGMIAGVGCMVFGLVHFLGVHVRRLEPHLLKAAVCRWR